MQRWIKKERSLEQRENRLTNQAQELTEKQAEAATLVEQQKAKLQEIAELSHDEAQKKSFWMKRNKTLNMNGLF